MPKHESVFFQNQQQQLRGTIWTRLRRWGEALVICCLASYETLRVIVLSLIVSSLIVQPLGRLSVLGVHLQWLSNLCYSQWVFLGIDFFFFFTIVSHGFCLCQGMGFFFLGGRGRGSSSVNRLSISQFGGGSGDVIAIIIIIIIVCSVAVYIWELDGNEVQNFSKCIFPRYVSPRVNYGGVLFVCLFVFSSVFFRHSLCFHLSFEILVVAVFLLLLFSPCLFLKFVYLLFPNCFFVSFSFVSGFSSFFSSSSLSLFTFFHVCTCTQVCTGAMHKHTCKEECNSLDPHAVSDSCSLWLQPACVGVCFIFAVLN